MIAHTLSIVKNADQILVVADGRIAESGTHDELLWKANAAAVECRAENFAWTMITGNDWGNGEAGCLPDRTCNQWYGFSEVKYGNRIAHVGPAPQWIICPRPGKNVGLTSFHAHFGNTMLTGGFEDQGHAVYTLKRDDALTLALTAAYKEGAHDTTWPPTNSDDVLATSQKIRPPNGDSLTGCEKRPNHYSDFQS